MKSKKKGPHEPAAMWVGPSARKAGSDSSVAYSTGAPSATALTTETSRSEVRKATPVPLAAASAGSWRLIRFHEVVFNV